MRCIAILAVIPFSFAAPLLSHRGFVNDIKGAIKTVGNIINSNATLSGVVGVVAQSIENPQLTAGAWFQTSAAVDTDLHGSSPINCYQESERYISSFNTNRHSGKCDWEQRLDQSGGECTERGQHRTPGNQSDRGCAGLWEQRFPRRVSDKYSII